MKANRIVILAWCIPVFAGMLRAQPVPIDPSTSPEPEQIDLADVNLGFAQAEDTLVDSLIERLGDFDFEQRESANRELIRIGPPAFHRMAEAYRQSDAFEVRIRIEEITRDRYLWHALLKHKGFLGIGFEPVSIPGASEDLPAIYVRSIQSASAADVAGLRAGDLIVAVDGESLADDREGSEFRDLIQSLGAGVEVTLDVLRDKRKIQFRVKLQARPLNQYDQTMVEELNRHLEAYSMWWANHFQEPRKKRERSPTSVVLEIPQ